MKVEPFFNALVAWSLITTTMSQSIYQIADIPIYSALAPCAMGAVSYAVNYLTYSKCPEGTAFQSCACTKQGNSASVQVDIISSVKYSCGATATEDLGSATLVFEQYCNQASGISTPGRGNTAVSQGITDIGFFADLAPCAASAVSYAINTMTNYKCQENLPMLHSCVCTKNQNSFLVSSYIQSNVQYTCGVSASADITSALALFAGWCKLADGTTDFPSTSNLAGSMSYYITDLPDYQALAKCAKSAVSRGAFTMTNYLCPEYPGALASCICDKNANSGYVSSIITSNVKYSCDNTATEDITSALAVLNEYCSAAKGELTVAGITTSIPERTTTANSDGADSSPKPTPTPKSNQPPRTSSPPSISTASDGSIVIIPGDSVDLPDTTTYMIDKGALAGMIVGIVAGIAILTAAIWFFWRRHKRNKAAAYSSAVLASSAGTEGRGGEADSDAAARAMYKGPNVNTSELHNEEAGAVVASLMSSGTSPRPTGSELAASPKPAVVRKPVAGNSLVFENELGGYPRPLGSELSGGGYADYEPGVHEAHISSPRPRESDLAGSGYAGHNPGVYEAPSGYGNVQQQQNQGCEYNGYQRQQVRDVHGNNAESVYEMPGQVDLQQASHQ